MRKRGSIGPVGVALVLASLALGARAAEAAKKPVCDVGRFTTATPLLPGSPAGGDVVELASGRIAIEGACGPAKVKLSGVAAGTRVKASFRRCSGTPGKVKLSGTISPDCKTLSASVRAAKTSPRWKREFGGALDEAVETCAYVPGAATAAPALAPRELQPRRLVPNTASIQEGYFLWLWGVVATSYVYPDFGGLDWSAVREDVLAQIRAGLSVEAFYELIAQVIEDLGDEHSFFLDPGEAKEVEITRSGGEAFVGMGVGAVRVGETDTATVTFVYPGSAAALAGLVPHDVLVAVDGGPVFDEDDEWRTQGEEGTSFELTFERPGGAQQTATLVRGLVAGFRPIDHCVVAGTRIAYLHISTFFDETIDDRVRAILRKLTATEPLSGLVVDVRVNGGGSTSVALPILGFFTDGLQGRFVGRNEEFDVTVELEDVGGSASVPLVVLTGADTVSFGELFAGALQNAERATLVGEPTAGNTEALSGWLIRDGSEIWLAAAEFDPEGPLPAGVWEGQGVQPDVLVPSGWHLFTAADDPGLAQAVELLQAP